MAGQTAELWADPKAGNLALSLGLKKVGSMAAVRAGPLGELSAVLMVDPLAVWTAVCWAEHWVA